MQSWSSSWSSVDGGQVRSGSARRGTVCERAKKNIMRGASRGASGAPAAPSMPAPASSSLLLALGRRRRRANRRRQRRRGGVRRGPGVRTRLADNPPARPGGAHLLRFRCWARRRDFNLCPAAPGWTVAGLLHAVQSPFLQHQNPTPGCGLSACFPRGARAFCPGGTRHRLGVKKRGRILLGNLG